MPIFFFDCFDGERRIVDAYGVDLTTKDEARDHAVALVQSLVVDAMPCADALSVEVTVRAADGGAVYVAQSRFTGGWTRDRVPTGPAPGPG